MENIFLALNYDMLIFEIKKINTLIDIGPTFVASNFFLSQAL